MSFERSFKSVYESIQAEVPKKDCKDCGKTHAGKCKAEDLTEAKKAKDAKGKKVPKKDAKKGGIREHREAASAPKTHEQMVESLANDLDTIIKGGTPLVEAEESPKTEDSKPAHDGSLSGQMEQVKLLYAKINPKSKARIAAINRFLHEFTLEGGSLAATKLWRAADDTLKVLAEKIVSDLLKAAAEKNYKVSIPKETLRDEFIRMLEAEGKPKA